VPDSPSLDSIDGDITIEAWVYKVPFHNIDFGVIVNKGGMWQPGVGYRNGFYLAIGDEPYNDGGILWILGTDTYQIMVYYGGMPVPRNQWTHVAVTLEGTNMYAYVNGVQHPTVGTFPAGQVFPSDYTLQIGAGDWIHPFEGKIDEVAIYNRALTLEEIQRHYQNGLEGLGYEKLSARSHKMDAIESLEAVNSLNEESQKKLDEALYYLKESVFGEPGDDEFLWIDDSHLYPDTGDDVFSLENDAVEKLMEILEKPTEYGASLTVVEEIEHIIVNKVLKSDEILAQTAISEAVGGASELLDEANQEMQSAQSAIADGEYDKAVEHYFKAWEAALKSVGII
jgi:hypothetical protein